MELPKAYWKALPTAKSKVATTANRMAHPTDSTKVHSKDSSTAWPTVRSTALQRATHWDYPKVMRTVGWKAGGKAPARGHWRDLVMEKPRAVAMAHPLDWLMVVWTGFPMVTMTAWRTPGATRSPRCIGLWTQSWYPRHHPFRRRNCCLAPGPN
jgi:hypothetical protein